MGLRNYSNAPTTTLSAGCDATATTISVAADPGFPAAPFTLILDEGQATEEVVLCTAKAGLQLTVTRGWDSSTTYAHSMAAVVAHGISAIDPREANAHVNADSNVHGVNGDLVGTTSTQTLTNKTLTTPTLDTATIHSPTIDHAVLTNQCDVTVDAGSSSVPLRILDSTGVVVGQITRAGTIIGPQFQSGKDNDWAGFIAYVNAAQSSSGFVVRKTDETPLAGFDANGNVFAQNLRPDNGTAPLYWYGSKSDADHITAATWEKLESYSVDRSNGNIGWTYSNGFLTIPLSGRYRITASAGFDGNPNGTRGIRIKYKNGATDTEFIRQMIPSGTSSSAAVIATVSKPMSSGGQIYIEVWQSSGGTLDAGGSTNGPCLLQCEWIGPS